MPASQSGTFNVQEFTDLGAPLVGGRLYTYVQGTTTQKAAYTDYAGTIPHTYTSDGLGGQYIALNSRGELPAPLYLSLGSYDLTLKTASGAIVWTRRADPIGSQSAFTQNGTGALLRTLQDKALEEVSSDDFPSLSVALTAIGSTPTLLKICSPAYVPDGTAMVIPSTCAVLIKPGGSIQRAVGGSATTSITFEGPLETYYGVFTGLNWTTKNAFIFHGNYADIDTTRFTLYNATAYGTNSLTLGPINFISGSGTPQKWIPNNLAFPVSEQALYGDVAGTDAMVVVAGHGSMPDPVVAGQELYHIRKYAIYTGNGAGSVNKRWDLDANAVDATSLFSNLKAFVIQGSTAPNVTLMVGVGGMSYDTTNHKFDPSTCSGYFGNVSAIFRKDGANKDIILLENRNGVTGDQANQLFVLQTTGTGTELNVATIKATGVEQTTNYQGRLTLQTRFQGTFKNNVTMTRDYVTIGAAAESMGAALEVCAKDDVETTPILLTSNSSQTVNGLLAYLGGGGIAATLAVIRMSKLTSNSRSISATGTINASGADYAEYMEKASPSVVINKGDVCGIDSNGKLTTVFADALSFVVKSTDPSYVGNDKWASGLVEPVKPMFKADEYVGHENPGQKPSFPELPPSQEVDLHLYDKVIEEYQGLLSQWEIDHAAFMSDHAAFEAKILADENAFNAGPMAQYELKKIAFDAAAEEARQKHDRIAFAGQVPVNVLNATPGQYIIPCNINGGICGIAVSSPTFEQYQAAVGKVIAVESDGRAKIIVKVI